MQEMEAILFRFFIFFSNVRHGFFTATLTLEKRKQRKRMSTPKVSKLLSHRVQVTFTSKVSYFRIECKLLSRRK